MLNISWGLLEQDHQSSDYPADHSGWEKIALISVMGEVWVREGDSVTELRGFPKSTVVKCIQYVPQAAAACGKKRGMHISQGILVHRMLFLCTFPEAAFGACQ